MKRLFIVTGASGKLGGAFVDEIKSRGEDVYSLVRKSTEDQLNKVLVVDLLDEEAVEKVFQGVVFSDYQEVVLIHAVGRFKFEGGAIDEENGIDKDVYNTNVVTTKNLLKVLIPSTKNSGLKVCAFASVSDKYNIPFWSSYTKAKNILRGYLQTLCEEQKISALMVNVTTVDTGNENLLRPKADKTYWLKPQEVVVKTLPALQILNGYQEIDIIKEKPDFNEDYYINHEALLQKWLRETGSDK